MTDFKSFKNSKQKLRKTWERNKNTTINLSNKVNLDKKFFNEIQKLKTPKIIYDSDWMAISPFPLDRSVIIGDIGASLSQLQLNADIKIDEKYLSFINWQLLVKTAPNVKIENFYQHTTHPLGSDWVQIKGDGTVIFDGQTTGNAIDYTTVYTDDDISSGKINAGFVKNVFDTEVRYMKDGDLHRIIGNLNRIILKVPRNTGCGGLDYDTYTSVPNYIDPGGIMFDSRPAHKYNTITPSSINAVWTKVDTNFVGTFPSCSESSTTINDVTESVNFSETSVEDYRTENGAIQKFVSGEWQTLLTGAVETDYIDSPNIVSRSFEKIGYWLYFYSIDNQRVNLFLIQANVIFGTNCRTNQYTPIISNRPDPTVVPYSNLYTEINKTGKPEHNEVTNSPLLFHTLHSNNPFYFKIEESHYKLFYNKTLFLTAPCTLLAENPTDRYVITYTSTGTFYASTSIICNNTNETEYVPEVQDVQVKLIGTLSNPFYWSEQRRYSDGL